MSEEPTRNRFNTQRLALLIAVIALGISLLSLFMTWKMYRLYVESIGPLNDPSKNEVPQFMYEGRYSPSKGVLEILVSRPFGTKMPSECLVQSLKLMPDLNPVEHGFMTFALTAENVTVQKDRMLIRIKDKELTKWNSEWPSRYKPTRFKITIQMGESPNKHETGEGIVSLDK